MPDPNAPPAYEHPDSGRPSSVAPTENQIEQEQPTLPPLDYSPAPAAHDPYAALRFPYYRRFSMGWMAAVIGEFCTISTITWEINDRLKDPKWLGIFAGIRTIPLFALALPAGVLADRFDRRRIIQISAVVNALCLVALAFFSYRPGSIPIMFALTLAGATALTISRPARSALLPAVVPSQHFSNAVTWNASLFQLSMMAGGVLSGFLIGPSLRRFGNCAIPYLLDAACALFYAGIVFFVPAPALDPAARKAQHPFQQLVAGLRFVWKTRIILATLTLDLFAVLLGGAVYLLPVFAQDILKVDAVKFGWLRAADALGSFAMAIVIAHMPPMKRAGRAMLLAVALFGAATIAFGLSRNFWLSMLFLVFIGAFDNISVVVRHTLVQVLTPDAMRGRVSAVNNIFIGASNDLGGLESGLTAAAFTALAIWMGYARENAIMLGPTISVVVGGIGTIVVVLLTAMIFPELRSYGPLSPPSPREGDVKA